MVMQMGWRNLRVTFISPPRLVIPTMASTAAPLALQLLLPLPIAWLLPKALYAIADTCDCMAVLAAC